MVSLLNKVYYRTADFYWSVLSRSSVGGAGENGGGDNNDLTSERIKAQNRRAGALRRKGNE